MSPTNSTANWPVILKTHAFAEQRFQNWIEAAEIAASSGARILRHLLQNRGQYERAAELGRIPPVIPGLLELTDSECESVQIFRNWEFLAHCVGELKSNSILSETEADRLDREIRARIAAVTRRLDALDIDAALLRASIVVQATIAGESANAESQPPIQAEAMRSTVKSRAESQADGPIESPGKPPGSNSPNDSSFKTHRSLLERLVDPRSLQWLTGLGALLMVAGLVILLWVNNFFTPQVVACTLGVANLALLSAGIATLRKTRQQFVGRALTLFSCLVMPLNLWYYSANNLVTIDGHLWIPAVMISVIYAFSAVTLKDKSFVYIFSAGIALTGLLMIADLPPSPQKFWEIPLPATWLVVLGVISIHVERAFSANSGAFSRKEFGLAFFWSGHVHLAVGLILVLSAQILGGWIEQPWFHLIFGLEHLNPSPICDELHWLALLLVGVATYAYTYSDWVVRRSGIYTYAAVFTLLWAEMLILQTFNIQLGSSIGIALMAATSILFTVVQRYVRIPGEGKSRLPGLGLVLGLVPVLFGGWEFVRHLSSTGTGVEVVPRWGFAAAMLLTTAAMQLGILLSPKVASSNPLRFLFCVGNVTAGMILASTVLANLGVAEFCLQAPVLLLIPIAIAWAAPRDRRLEVVESNRWGAHLVAAFILTMTLVATLRSVVFAWDASKTNDLLRALLYAELALFYGLSAWRDSVRFAALIPVTLCLSFWQALSFCSVSPQVHMVAFAIVGLLALVLQRMCLDADQQRADRWEWILHSTNAVLSVAVLSSVFHGLFQLLSTWNTSDQLHWEMVGFQGSMLLIGGFSAWLNRQAGWRRWYVVVASAQLALCLLALHRLSSLSPWQKMELLTVAGGFSLLVFGHLGWYREQRDGKRVGVVGTCLGWGALCASVPLALATWIHRYHGDFIVLNEFGFLFVSILLLASGLVLELKSTTLVGGAMTLLYFLTLAILVPWSQLNSVALAILSGGAILFGSGLSLAFFRESLLRLPESIRARKGLFRILNWR